MLGGYQILDLRGIDLSISQSASDITNANVLNQLLKLRDYIDKAYNFSKPLENQLKPVLIRFRDKKANEKIEGATFGELSVVDNYYSFKITARLSGVLVLTINVTFEEVENGYGNMEWIIDDATIQLADETQTINGDLEVTGDLEADEISGNSIIEKMSGYAFSKLIEVEGLTREFVYAGVVKNGNKLTFVIACNYTRTDTITGGVGYLGSFDIPSAISSRLYSTPIGSGNYLDLKANKAFQDEGNSKDIVSYTTKGSNAVAMYTSGLNELTLNVKYYVRYEVTFLLSDNLIPQE